MSIKPIMEGFLQKLKCHRSIMGGNWNKRYWRVIPIKVADPLDYICIKEIIDAEFKINFPIGKIEIGEEPRTDFGHINSEIKSHYSTVFIIKSLSRNFMFNCESPQIKQKWIYCFKKLSDKPLNGLRWQSEWGEEPQLPHYLEEFYKKRKEKSLPKELRIVESENENNNNDGERGRRKRNDEGEEEDDDEKSSPVKPIRKGQPLLTPRVFSKAKSCDIPSKIKNIHEDASEPPKYRAPRRTMLPTVDDLKKIDIQHSKSNNVNSSGGIVEESDVKIIHVKSVPGSMNE